MLFAPKTNLVRVLIRALLFSVVLCSAASSRAGADDLSLSLMWTKDYELEAPVLSIAEFAQDGRSVLLFSHGRRARCELLAAETGEHLFTASGSYTGAIMCADGGHLLCSGNEGFIDRYHIASKKRLRREAFPRGVVLSRHRRLLLKDESIACLSIDGQSIMRCRPGHANSELLFDFGNNVSSFALPIAHIALIYADADDIYAMISGRLCAISVRQHQTWRFVNDSVRRIGMVEYTVLNHPRRIVCASRRGLFLYGIEGEVREIPLKSPLIGCLSDDENWLVGYKDQGERQPHEVELVSVNGGTRIKRPFYKEKVADVDLHWSTRRFVAANYYGEVCLWGIVDEGVQR